MPWKFRQQQEKKPWHSHLIVRLALVVLVGGTIAAIPYGRSRYRDWNERRRLGRAKEAMMHGDFRQALLEARAVIAANPKNGYATEIIERSKAALQAPDAMSWRRMQKAMEAEDTDELLGLADAFLKIDDFASADQVLEKVKAGDRDQARFHLLAARVTASKGDPAASARHWSEAVRLNAEDHDSRLQLAALQLASDKPETRAAAQKTIEEIKAQPGGRLPALRALLADAQRRRDRSLERDLATEIASDPEAEFSDKLALLTSLQALRPKRDQEFFSYLADLQESAAAEPTQIFSLMGWMVDHDLALLVPDWESKLPAEVVAALPVAPGAAAADVKAAAWQRLRERTETADWGDMDFLRLALLSHALERLGDWNAANTNWNTTLEVAAARPELLERLAKVTRLWGWKERTEEVLWKLAPSEWCPRWAMDYLWSAALARGDTAKLYEASKLRLRAQPGNLEDRNNELSLALLTGRGGPAAHQLAETLFKENPQYAFAASTYAYSLFQQGQAPEAVAVLEKLAPEKLRDPAIAQYYGVFLAATGQTDRAAAYLRLAPQTAQLPEEKNLVDFYAALCQTRSLQGRGDETGAQTAWGEAVGAAAGQPDRLETLAKMALDWGWPARAEPALLKLAEFERCPAWASDSLWTAALKTNDSAQIYRASRLVAKTSPESAAAQTNFILLALLGRHEKDVPFAVVEAHFRKNAENPEAVAAYGLALLQQGKPDEAVAMMTTLKPAQLSEPRAALYLGIFLAAAGRADEAQTQLRNGMAGLRFPEEKALIGLIQLAFEAAKLDHEGNANGADTAWSRALSRAQERPDWLEMLGRLALKSGPARLADAALWKLSTTENCPRWAIDTLWASALKTGTSAERYKASKLVLKADPKSGRARSNSIILALLTGQEIDAPERQAEAFYQRNVGNPDAIVTYGLSLYLQDRAEEAAKLTTALSPEQLREPHTALYHGIFLASGATPAKALDYLRLAASAPILPEERALLEKVAAIEPLRAVWGEDPPQ